MNIEEYKDRLKNRAIPDLLCDFDRMAYHTEFGHEQQEAIIDEIKLRGGRSEEYLERALKAEKKLNDFRKALKVLLEV